MRCNDNGTHRAFNCGVTTGSIGATALDRYTRTLRGLTLLSAEEEQVLAKRFVEGDTQAGQRLIEANLPFVVSIAKRYRRWGVPLEDLIQQGNIGLLKGVAKFDPTKNCRVITYASFWIRAEIREYVVRGYRIVRLGTTRTERRAIRDHRKQGFESAEALAESSGMPLHRARQLMPVLRGGDLHLDAPLSDGGDWHSYFASDEASPETLTAGKIDGTRLAAVVDDALKTLSAREKKIVEHRVLSDTPVTLAELGVGMGVSKERVRQLEARAYDKLRERLADFRPAA